MQRKRVVTNLNKTDNFIFFAQIPAAHDIPNVINIR
jgi:hypothetical protein